MNVIEEARSGARAMVVGVLERDELTAGRVTGGTVELLTELTALGRLSPLDAVQRGKARERRDVIAFLRSRQRAAMTVAARNPEEAERAQAIAAQIGVEIEAIENALHEGEALVQREVAGKDS